MANERPPSELARLFATLHDQGIRFQIAGMVAATLQGVPLTTFDTDIWIDLPSRSYMRVMNICHGLGAQVLAKTVAVLKDGTEVNFLYRVDGLRSFSTEYRGAKKIRWQGLTVRVLPLKSLIKSKEAVRRPKDLAHLPLLKTALKALRP